MDSDLDVGRHCKQCNLKDFLPIFCQYCQQNFCRTHIFEHSGCNSRSISTPVAKSSGESLSCAFCSQSSILTCTNCLKFVCPSHRFHDGCNPPIVQSASPTATEKNLAAHALLAKHFPPKPNPPVVVMKKSQDPRIQLMKMRHKAIPLVPKDLSTASTERIHFTVICGSQEKIFWCRKTLITGRAIDLIAQQFHVTISDTAPVRLMSSAGRAFPNNIPMSQVTDGETIELV